MEISEIMQIIEAFKANGLTSFELKEGETSISLKRETPSNTVYLSGMPMQAGTVGAPAATQSLAAAPEALAALQTLGAASAAQANTAAASGQSAPERSADAQAGGAEKVVVSPLVGVFYNAPSPDAEPFIRVGAQVKKGQVIGIVEAMKLMNEIESDQEGIVTEILIENEDVVEYGQPLIRVK